MRTTEGLNRVLKSPETMAIFDRNGVCILASDSWKQVVDPPHETVLGKHLTEILPEESEHWLSTFYDSVAYKKTLHFSDFFTSPATDSPRKFECTFEPFFKNDQSLEGIMIKLKQSPQNGTSASHKQNDDTFKHSEGVNGMRKEIFKGNNKYRTLTRNMRNIVCLHDLDGTYVYVSPSFTKTLGYSSEEVIGKNPRDFVHPEDVEQVNKKIQKNSGENIHISETEFRFRHKEGHYIWLHTYRHPLLENGKVIALQTETCPIQERKELEIQLKESEVRFRESFEHSATGMALVDLKGNWMNVNKRMCEITGYGKEELLEMSYHDLTHPDDLKKDLEELRTLISGETEAYHTEKRYMHKSGEPIWVDLAVSMLTCPAGTPKHFVVHIKDINERKKTEEEFQQLMQITEEQNSRLVNFAHIASHNLSSHSSNISMLLDLLSEETDEEERDNILEMIRKASKNLKVTIDNLNEVAKRKDHEKTGFQTMPLRATIDKVQSDIEALLLKNYAIVRNKVPGDIEIQAVPAYLESILLNLFTNAIKYSHKDRTPVITITAEEQDDTLKMTFADNGRGIDLDKHGNDIFRLHQTFHDNEDARGIGLFITKNQVEAMGGSIKVESAVGEGTRFYLEFKDVESKIGVLRKSKQ